MRDELQNLIVSLGQVADHLTSSLRDVSRFSAGQAWVSSVVRGFTALVGALAVLGGVRRLRHGFWDMSAALMAASPLTALVASAYGGEILFRAYFFALPFLAFFAAALACPAPHAKTPSAKTQWRTAAALALSVVLLAGFLVSYYGKDRQYRFTQNEVAAAEYLYRTAPPGSLLVEGSRNYPSQFLNYEHFTYVPLASEPEETQLRVAGDPVGVLSRWMGDSKYAAAYLIITRSQKNESEAIGSLPPGSLEKIEQALSASPLFRAIYANTDVSIYALSGNAKEEQP